MVPTSALSGQGIPELLQTIVDRLVPTPPGPGVAVPFTIEQREALGEALQCLERGDAAAAAGCLAALTTPRRG